MSESEQKEEAEEDYLQFPSDLNGRRITAVDLIAMGYDKNLLFYYQRPRVFQGYAALAPCNMPDFSMYETTSASLQSNKKRGKKDKYYCVLFGSCQIDIIKGMDREILVPFQNDGTPNLSFVQKALIAEAKRFEGKRGATIAYLAKQERLYEDLRIFDLPKLGLQIIALPDPRPLDLQASTAQKRVDVNLVHDIADLPCFMWLAEHDFDMAQIRDIFGPVLILFQPSPSPRNFKLKHLRGYITEYLGLGRTEPPTQEEKARYLAAMYQPMPTLRKEYKKQIKGKAPYTDVLSYAPKSVEYDNEFLYRRCGNPLCPDLGDESETFHVNKKLCSGCKGIYYCSQECQHVHWKEHKLKCKQVAAKRSYKSAIVNCPL